MPFLNRTIEKNTPVPLYFQLKNIILDEIESGHIQPNETIPTEAELCSMYDISRTTVRQAISELVNEGKLYRVKSKGTFISPPNLNSNAVNLYYSFFASAEQVSMEPKMKVDSIDLVDAPPKVLAGLALSEPQKVIRIHRHQIADSIITSCIESYLLYPLCAHVMDAAKLEQDPLWKVIDENPETALVHITRRISARTANAKEAERLHIKTGDSIILLENKGISDQGRRTIIMEYVRYIGKINTLVIEQEIDQSSYDNKYQNRY